MESDQFDVVVVGAGSGGVSLASTLVEAGRSVALVASGFVGGECPYVACMPSKSLLRSARGRTEIRTAARHGAATDDVAVDGNQAAWRMAVSRRDSVANHRDDSEHTKSLQDAGITVIRGFGAVDGPGRVVVDGSRVMHAIDVVLDVGSVPVIPDIAGLADVPTWTSDEALCSADLPTSLIILGGGPIGCELAQAYSRFGVTVTVVDPSERLLSSEDPPIGHLMADVLAADGVSAELGSEPVKAAVVGGLVELTLGSGRIVRGERVLIAVGRRPASEGVDAPKAGAELADDGSIKIDVYCRAADHLWAIGDVTGVAPYTHTANHQASVVADAILGRARHEMTPDALPRAVFTDPPAAGAGLTEDQARERDMTLVVAEVDLATGSRAGAEGEGPLGPENASGGLLRLIADVERQVLIGASAIGPDADSWIGEATLAIRAAVPISLLADVVRPFPTFAEAYTLGYRDLVGQMHNDDHGQQGEGTNGGT